MPTLKQQLGRRGESLVIGLGYCPKCKKRKTLKALPPNFKCADVICDFCGYQAQVKTARVDDPEKLPSKFLGGAWGPQKEWMDAGVFLPLFLVAIAKNEQSAIYDLPSDFQTMDMFQPRKPLPESAQRKGWQGFVINLESAAASPIRLARFRDRQG